MKKNNVSVWVVLSFFLLVPLQFSQGVTAANVLSPFLFDFNASETVAETSDMANSSSPYWALNSGAYLKMDNGRGSTVQGSLPSTDFWRLLYANNNPQDTDGGYHPQNIFRLLTRSKWQNARQEAYFVINKDNLSSSSNRNASNGLLLFNRYQDSDNLYYTGVRVDGSAIIKKKKNGVYYTMAEIKGIYPGTYNKSSAPNLLPKNKWIGLRSVVTNVANGSVRVDLYLDKGWSGQWVLVASAVDNGSQYGGAAFTNEGYGGIRTDFMDVTFENFRLRNL